MGRLGWKHTNRKISDPIVPTPEQIRGKFFLYGKSKVRQVNYPSRTTTYPIKKLWFNSKPIYLDVFIPSPKYPVTLKPMSITNKGIGTTKCTGY